MSALDTSAFVGKFVEEAGDRLKALSEALLRLEQAPGNDDAMAEVFRQAHSLKGSALMLGFTDMSQIAHQLEDLFVAAKRDPRVIDALAFDLVFGAIDVLSPRVEQLARGNAEPVDIAELCRKLATLVRRQPPARTDGDRHRRGRESKRGGEARRVRRRVCPLFVSRCACRSRSSRA